MPTVVDELTGLGGESAAELDPLGFDRMVPLLHKLNAARDVDGLGTLLLQVLPSRTRLTRRPRPEQLAMMRDLGLVAGSIRACDVEPVDVVPGLEETLLTLGACSAMVPRDTLYHYVACNPVGVRERTYTGDVMETMLVSSVRSSMPRVTAAVNACRHLLELDPATPDFAVTAHEVVVLVRAVDDAIDATRATVTPAYFAGTMRRFFEPVLVAGTPYLGPAAAHMPLYLVDLALWASDCESLEYREFWRESAVYGLPMWRELSERWAHGPSLVTRLREALDRHRDDERALAHLRASAEGVSRVMRGLIAFRGKHLSLARETYDDGASRYALGSGGGTTDLLALITDLSRDNAAVVNRLLGIAGGRRARP